METMVATVLIVIVFMLSSFLLNRIFSTSIRNNTTGLTEHLHQLEYAHAHGLISIPYEEEWEGYTIVIEYETRSNTTYLRYETVQQRTQKKQQTYSSLGK